MILQLILLLMFDVSVIVPIYGVEKYIARCAESLMHQSLPAERVEYIFVDDATPDGSLAALQKVLERYPERNCKVLHHEVNKGLPAARNTGLSAAAGKYVFHCDSDDFVAADMLKKLLEKAEEIDADIVWCDFWLDFGERCRRMAARDYKTPDDLIRRGYLAGDMKYNVWNKLSRRSLYEGISFPDGHSMGEDMTMILLAQKAEKVAYVPEALYYYNLANVGAMSHSFKPRQLEDIKFNTARVEASLGEEYGTDVQLFKLNVKLPFLLTGLKEDYRRWREWFPESNAFIWQNEELPFRTKFLQGMASVGFWPGVKAYAWLMSKI